MLCAPPPSLGPDEFHAVAMRPENQLGRDLTIWPNDPSVWNNYGLMFVDFGFEHADHVQEGL